MADAKPERSSSSKNQEKLEAIRALFGEQVAMSLAKQVQSNPSAPTRTADPTKLQWQQNQLIERLRSSRRTTDFKTETTTTAQRAGQLPGPIATKILRTPVADLSAEHPAIIAFALKSHDQSNRVAALKSLPGQTARAVMQRLRARG